MRTRFSIVSTRRYSRSERKQPPAGGNTVNDGSAGLGYAIGVGTAAGVDPARFKAFEAGGFVDEFDEFARLFRAGHGRGDGGAAGVDGDAVAPGSSHRQGATPSTTGVPAWAMRLASEPPPASTQPASKPSRRAASLMSSTSSRVFSVQGMAGETEARRASTVMPSPQFMAASLIG